MLNIYDLVRTIGAWVERTDRDISLPRRTRRESRRRTGCSLLNRASVSGGIDRAVDEGTPASPTNKEKIVKKNIYLSIVGEVVVIIGAALEVE